MSTIIKLTSENVKRLKAVSVTPTGATVLIGGRNGQGKSSLLDSIAMALGGKNEVPSEPLRRGEKRGTIVLETQEIIVTRKFTPGGTTLEVTNKEGLKFPSPQTVLDKLCASIAFDPLAFIHAEKKEQVRQLMGLVGINPLDIDNARKIVYDERTLKNRMVKEQEARVLALPADAPARVNTAEVLEELETARKHNEAVIDAANNHGAKLKVLNDLIEDMAETNQRIHAMKLEIEDLEVKRSNLSASADAAELVVTAALEASQAMTPIDLDPINAKLASADETNQQAAKGEQRKLELTKLREVTQEADALTDRIKELDEKKLAMMASAKFPVPGLSFDETGVTFNGIPLDQASSAEQLRIGLAIACQMNPSLKVMLIRDGSLLDDDSLKIVEEMAIAHDAQVWIERVGDDGKCTVVIEDGEVKGEPVPEPAPTVAEEIKAHPLY